MSNCPFEQRLAACETVSDVVAVANDMHNPRLVDPDEAPNANIIYRLWCDGQLTSEKGGAAFGQRSVYVYQNVSPSPFKPEAFTGGRLEVMRGGVLTYVIVKQKQGEALLQRAAQLSDRRL